MIQGTPIEIDMSQLTEPVAALGAVGASTALGFVKSKTRLLDTWIGRKLKPVQPLVIYGAAIGLPYLVGALGIAPVDPEVFAAAPTATVATIAAREVLKRIRGR